MSKRRYGSPTLRKDSHLLLSKTARLSQACDRCRLKKIKCDGARPSCVACTKVGFHCQHSDKLSRRGIPKNYTDSLEKEVVRLQQLLGEAQARSTAASPGANRNSDPYPPSLSNSPFDLPFVNDTFHLYNNHVNTEGRFVGHATWNMLANSMSELPMDTLPNEDEWLLRYLVRQFQLSQDRIPTVLLSRYQQDAILCEKRIQKSISHFLDTSMALIPILNPDSWRDSLLRIPHSKNVHPAVLLSYLFICQWQWSCFSDEKLFTATKFVCLNSTKPLLRLQSLLLASFYFMGTPGMSLLSKCSTAPFASQLLRLAYAEMINLGLFINSHRLTPIEPHAALNHIERLTTFWCFQFLDSWWTLLQGLPKTNFTTDEFLPPKLSTLNNPKFKPFELLVDFVVGCLDGCNLLKALSQGSYNTHMVYVLETFRKQLFQYSLYHRLADHDVQSFSALITNVDQPLAIEIQITLYYLVMSLFTNLKATETTIIKKVAFEPNSQDATKYQEDYSSTKRPTCSSKIMKALSSQRENAYEILTLYYLTIVDHNDSKNVAPLQFKALHLLPCENFAVIKVCLETLASWASSKFAKDDPEYQLIYNRCRSTVEAWCNLWYFDEPEDDLLTRLQTLFDFSLVLPSPRTGQVFDKLLYLHSMKLQSRRALLLNQNNDTQTTGNVEEPLSLFGGDNMAMRIPTSETINALFNPIAMQEEDEGYAEDDDEDDDAFLEIPIVKKKQTSQRSGSNQASSLQYSHSGSLFDHRRPGPMPRRVSDGMGAEPDHLNGLLKDDSTLKAPGTFGEKWTNEHYLLVQGYQKPSSMVGTPRSLADLLAPSSDVVIPSEAIDRSKLSTNQT
ncbi:LANO_0D08372g1_1 [Lachancea nothofagi CBS 11611]|uniref:LANO_0D08372g1_1 n=1 Tax=Lachancea nothofagi CBS 11611 TaxID=1266666 RepID=A0A1G4JIP1_9SACH|nr:LANO_0D08372g1_1 [Lachancea nothofagi CBS 11611]